MRRIVLGRSVGRPRVGLAEGTWDKGVGLEAIAPPGRWQTRRNKGTTCHGFKWTLGHHLPVRPTRPPSSRQARILGSQRPQAFFTAADTAIHSLRGAWADRQFEKITPRGSVEWRSRLSARSLEPEISCTSPSLQVPSYTKTPLYTSYDRKGRATIPRSLAAFSLHPQTTTALARPHPAY